jgi:hypothetical protein
MCQKIMEEYEIYIDVEHLSFNNNCDITKNANILFLFLLLIFSKSLHIKLAIRRVLPMWLSRVMK